MVDTDKLSGNLDIDSDNVVKFTASVDDLVKICAPPGHPPAAQTNESYKQLAGFTILKPYLGDFEGAVGNRCIKYRHKRSGQQIIRYDGIGIQPTVFYAMIDGITVHDHASVVTGGPAFATYYTEKGRKQE